MGIKEFTFIRSLKMYIELLHAIIDHLHFVIAHHPIQTNPTKEKKKQKKKNQKKLSTKENEYNWKRLINDY